MENSNFIMIYPGKISTYYELTSFWHNMKASCEKNEKFQNFNFYLFIWLYHSPWKILLYEGLKIIFPWIFDFILSLQKIAHESHMWKKQNFWKVVNLIISFHFLVSEKILLKNTNFCCGSSASLSGGNLDDGLPPVLSLLGQHESLMSQI